MQWCKLKKAAEFWSFTFRQTESNCFNSLYDQYLHWSMKLQTIPLWCAFNKKKISIINIRVKKELRAEMIKMTHLMDTDPTLNPVLRHKVTSNRGFGFGFRKSQVFSQFFELRRTRTTKCNWVGGEDYVLRSTRVISCSDPVISCHLSFLKTHLFWFLTVFICFFIFSSLSLL